MQRSIVSIRFPRPTTVKMTSVAVHKLKRTKRNGTRPFHAAAEQAQTPQDPDHTALPKTSKREMDRERDSEMGEREGEREGEEYIHVNTTNKTRAETQKRQGKSTKLTRRDFGRLSGSWDNGRLRWYHLMYG